MNLVLNELLPYQLWWEYTRSMLMMFENVLTQTLLSRAPMASVINRFFNSERCCPFSSNNGPVCHRDWDVDSKIPSDALYVGTCCFYPSSRGQDHDYPQLVAFGIRPWATDCSWPRGSVIRSFVSELNSHCPKRYTQIQYVDSSFLHNDIYSCLLRQLSHYYLKVSVFFE